MNELIIELDKPRKIKFSMNALIAASKDISKIDKKPCTVQVLLSKFYGMKPQDVTFEDIRFLAWCGLKHDDATLTLEKVGDIFDLPAFAKFGAEIEKLFFASFPKDAELPKKKPVVKKNIKSKVLKKKK